MRKSGLGTRLTNRIVDDEQYFRLCVGIVAHYGWRRGRWWRWFFHFYFGFVHDSFDHLQFINRLKDEQMAITRMSSSGDFFSPSSSADTARMLGMPVVRSICVKTGGSSMPSFLAFSWNLPTMFALAFGL